MKNTDYLKIAQKRQQEMRESGELVVSHNPAQKIANLSAVGRKISANQAIKAKCWECMGGTEDEWDSDIRKTIRECTAAPWSETPCPLWCFRPYK